MEARLELRIDPDDKARLQTAATRAGLSMTDFVLQCALPGTGDQRAKWVAMGRKGALAEMTAALRALGK